MSEELRRALREREREKELRRERRNEFRRDVLAVASGPEGERFLRRLLDDADIFLPGFRPDPEGAFHAGRRDAGLRLWRLLRENLPPERFAAIALAERPDPLAIVADTGRNDDGVAAADGDDTLLGEFF
ncbi:MAG: hypothetical protein LIQ30_07565 [Planctomycetes bacterium]|nr:hypothetical protein [Planctomycetota bacterium]MCD7895764.1 hypothetical protein [Planctomycetaceae bacterium]